MRKYYISYRVVEIDWRNNNERDHYHKSEIIELPYEIDSEDMIKSVEKTLDSKNDGNCYLDSWQLVPNSF
jgi:hypothetical protein